MQNDDRFFRILLVAFSLLFAAGLAVAAATVSALPVATQAPWPGNGKADPIAIRLTWARFHQHHVSPSTPTTTNG